jgi:DNA-binding winged helix-turn-helix (wHTH) protein
VESLTDHSYVFGRYRLTIFEGEVRLLSDGNPLTLNPAEARALRMLVENHGKLVKKQALIECVDEKVCDEHSLHKIILKLRLLLNDSSGQSRLIKNERGKGYKFIADVERVPYGIDGPPPPVKTVVKPDEPVVLIEHQAKGKGKGIDSTPLAFEGVNDGMDTFKEWILGPGRWVGVFLLVCVLLVLALSFAGIRNKWESINSLVSVAQFGVLLIALLYPLQGPNRFKESGQNLAEDIKRSTLYDQPEKWQEASGIAEKVLERYRIYWRGILVTWFLLYACLALAGWPSVDLNCQIDNSRFCVGGLNGAGKLVAKLQTADAPGAASQPTPSQADPCPPVNPHARNSLTSYLQKTLSPETWQQIKAYGGPSTPLPRQTERGLVEGLNRTLKQETFYSSGYQPSFSDCFLSDETRELSRRERQLSERELARLNRSLWEAIYSDTSPETFSQRAGVAVRICTTLLNNFSSLMLFLCFNILNKPTKVKSGTGTISDSSLSRGAAVVIIALVLEILMVTSASTVEIQYFILQLGGWTSGIAGGVAMALYIGRLQSKFLQPPGLLVILLYSYTVIQSLFVFLEERQEWAVALMDFALIMKCLLFLYMAWLFKSGRLLFYLVRVRRTYEAVGNEFGIFRRIIEE